MPSDVAVQIRAQSPDELRTIISQILDAEATPLGKLTSAKVGRSVGQATVGIFRVTGRARTRDGETPWSAVVKALGVPQILRPGSDYDAYRELDVYRSRAFAERCGGVRAARCYAIQPRDELQLLWLEDLSDAPQPPCPAKSIANSRSCSRQASRPMRL